MPSELGGESKVYRTKFSTSKGSCAYQYHFSPIIRDDRAQKQWYWYISKIYTSTGYYMYRVLHVHVHYSCTYWVTHNSVKSEFYCGLKSEHKI
eukprot:SAG11_NODE_12877_length_681_cov_1.762887_1_plen_93_part_00